MFLILPCQGHGSIGGRSWPTMCNNTYNNYNSSQAIFACRLYYGPSIGTIKLQVVYRHATLWRLMTTPPWKVNHQCFSSSYKVLAKYKNTFCPTKHLNLPYLTSKCWNKSFYECRLERNMAVYFLYGQVIWPW